MTDADHDGNQNPRTQAEQERLAKLRLLGREVRLLNRFDARYETLKNESAAREQQYLRELEDAHAPAASSDGGAGRYAAHSRGP